MHWGTYVLKPDKLGTGNDLLRHLLLPLTYQARLVVFTTKPLVDSILLYPHLKAAPCAPFARVRTRTIFVKAAGKFVTKLGDTTAVR